MSSDPVVELARHNQLADALQSMVAVSGIALEVVLPILAARAGGNNTASLGSGHPPALSNAAPAALVVATARRSTPAPSNNANNDGPEDDDGPIEFDGAGGLDLDLAFLGAPTPVYFYYSAKYFK